MNGRMDNKQIYALGVGHNTPVFIDLAEQSGYEVVGLYHYNNERTGETDHGYKIIGSFEDLFSAEDLSNKNFMLTMGDNDLRCDLIKKIIDKGYKSEEISEELINENLDLPECPDVDLLIRTGGEQRLSNYLLWHVAYAEQVYTNTLWPDYNEEEFTSNIENFTKRNRRFGAEK